MPRVRRESQHHGAHRPRRLLRGAYRCGYWGCGRGASDVDADGSAACGAIMSGMPSTISYRSRHASQRRLAASSTSALRQRGHTRISSSSAETSVMSGKRGQEVSERARELLWLLEIRQVATVKVDPQCPRDAVGERL